jgi:hypothetical protein
MTKKILLSPGWGAGWSTWNPDEVAKFMLTYQPIIDFIEAGGSFKRNETSDLHGDHLHPLLMELADEVKAAFGKDYVCVLGAIDLEVVSVDGPFKITEYDGNESIQYRDEEQWEEA